MKKVAFKMHLYPGRAPEYKKRHDQIWPELAGLLKQCGISDYSIFLDEATHSLFGVFSSQNPEALNKLPDQEIMKKWWAYMSDIMETNPDQSPRSTPLVELFYLK
jgi:L-rhamnose mutarotase